MIIPSRRAFFLGAAAVLAAPAIARASSLMPISVLRPPKLWGDGIHDDTAALQWLIDKAGDTFVEAVLPSGTFRITKTLEMTNSGRLRWGNARLIMDVPATNVGIHIGESPAPLDFYSLQWNHLNGDSHGSIGYLRT